MLPLLMAALAAPPSSQHAIESVEEVEVIQPAAQAPQRGIVNVTGQLYRAQNNNHYTVFLVTPDGIILSDPINRDFGRWLKAEMASRFKVPVRYVHYTHRDWDHASGGVVFADTAEFVGHRNMLAGLAALALNSAVSPLASAHGLPRPKKQAGPQGARKRFLVMLDPGHGGIDSGAIGHTGSLEKHVVLAIARNVRAQLDRHAVVPTTEFF